MFTDISKYIGRIAIWPLNKPLAAKLQRAYRVAWEFWNTLPMKHIIMFLDFNEIFQKSEQSSLERMMLLEDLVYQCPHLYIVITNCACLSAKNGNCRKDFSPAIQARIIGVTGPVYAGKETWHTRVIRCDDSEYNNWRTLHFCKDIEFRQQNISQIECKAVTGLTKDHVLIISSRYHWLMKTWL